MGWTLKRKILFGYGVALTLLAVVLLVGILNLQQLGRASDAILSENYRSIQAAEHMLGALERQDSGVLLYLLGLREEGAHRFSAGQSEFLQWLARAKDNVTIPGEGELLARIDSSYSRYLEAFVQLRREGVADAGAAAAYRGRVSSDFLGVLQATRELRDLNQRTMFTASARAREISHRATLSLSVVGVLVIAFGLAFSLVLANRVTHPIADITHATRRIAGGDYEVEVPVSTSDELGTLARDFTLMAAELRSYREMNVEQLRAEKRKSEAIIESIEDGLIVVDADLRVVDINPAARRLLGRDSRDAEGRHVLEILKNEPLSGLVEKTVRSGETPEIDERERYLSTVLDWNTRHFLVAVTPVRVRGRRSSGAVLLFRDVTELRELDRTRREFLATISHELKTPLTSVTMSVDLLAESAGDELGPVQRDMLQGIREDVGRLRTLVDELLDLSRLEAGKIDFDFQPVEIELICQKAFQVLEAQARDQGLKLVLCIGEQIPRVRADVNKITWVVTNLISNAVRYSSRGGSIEVGASHSGSHVEISVRDFGVGIPYEYQSRIFERFVRIGDGAPGGSGLGLAICRELVRAHGGSIWVESLPGEGSTFRFTLPVAS